MVRLNTASKLSIGGDMSEQILRGQGGVVLGKIVDKGSELWIYDAQGRCKGVYRKDTNITKDSSGKTIGTGNLLATLIK